MATDKNNHLQKVLDSHDINKLESLDKFIEKKNQVKEALSNRFSSKKAGNPIDSGSYAKKTPINTKFDIDCCIPFKKKTTDDENGFSSLEDMYKEVYEYLKNDYTKDDSDITSDDVRKQKTSIGLKFKIDGEDFEMDVVPGRERPNHGDYNDDNTDLSLYINPSQRSQKEKDENKTRIKTNIKKHISLLAGSDKIQERKVAKLLKVWKTERKKFNGGKLIKSFIMELYTLEAFQNAEEIPIGIWGKTKMVMQYIVDNIESNDLIDPANSDNKITDSMSDSAKKETRKSMENTIKDIEDDSDKIKEYFPINEVYAEEDENNDGYNNGKRVAAPSVFSKDSYSYG